MIWMIICTVIVRLIAIKLKKSKPELSSFDNFCSIFAGLIFGILATFMIGGALGFVFPTEYKVEDIPICEIGDSASGAEDIYLLVEQENDSTVLEYVTDTEEGKQYQRTLAEQAYIKEGNYTPAVKVYTKQFTRRYYYWFAIDLLLHDKQYIELYVPTGTIKDNIHTNL